MAARDDQVDLIHHVSLDEQLQLNLLWKSEHMDLELVKDVDFEAGPSDRHVPGLSDLLSINLEHTVRVQPFGRILLGLHCFRQLALRISSLDQIEQNVLLVVALVHLQVIESELVVLLVSDVHDLLPSVVNPLGLSFQTIFLEI